ncbi:hypothetical protein BU17DRAFT_63714 [Hysterangium stoloniferum]|nr:hypothetical protein BU17DRAFT_63714 [Hysterangium stoloniferum]
MQTPMLFAIIELSQISDSLNQLNSAPYEMGKQNDLVMGVYSDEKSARDVVRGKEVYISHHKVQAISPQHMVPGFLHQWQIMFIIVTLPRKCISVKSSGSNLKDCLVSAIEFVILNSVDEVTDMVNMTLSTMFTNTTLIQAASDSHNWGKSAAGGVALVLFDYFLTLDAEITHVWRRSWSLTKMIFFFGRYVGIINSLLFATMTTVHQSSVTMYLLLDVKIGSGILLFDSLLRGRGIVVTAFAPTNALMALRLHNLFRDTKYTVYRDKLCNIPQFPRHDNGIQATYGMLSSNIRELSRARPNTGMFCISENRTDIETRWIVAIYNIAGSRLVMLHGGNLNDSSGIFENGNEFRIDMIPKYELSPARTIVLRMEEST